MRSLSKGTSPGSLLAAVLAVVVGLGFPILTSVGAASLRDGITDTQSPTSPGRVHLFYSQQWRAAHPVPLTAQPPLTYHGGPIMRTSKAYAIFWLPPGKVYQTDGNNTQYESLIKRYFEDVGASLHYNILTQYGDKVGPTVNSSDLGGAFVDTRPYPAAGTDKNPLTDGDLQAEVTHAMSLNGWHGGLTNQFFVFTAYGTVSCLGSGVCSDNAFCAYHSAYTNSAGENVIYGNMPGGPVETGCSYGTSPNHDLSADAEIDTLSHEQFEEVNDPLVGFNSAWFDATGSEIGDKCAAVNAFDYGKINPDGSNNVMNGNPYIMQGEWSNRTMACPQSQQPRGGIVNASLACTTSDTKLPLCGPNPPGCLASCTLDLNLRVSCDSAGCTPAPGTRATIGSRTFTITSINPVISGMVELRSQNDATLTGIGQLGPQSGLFSFTGTSFSGSTARKLWLTVGDQTYHWSCVDTCLHISVG